MRRTSVFRMIVFFLTPTTTSQTYTFPYTTLFRSFGCYHPSQQNTFTGRLNQQMVEDVLVRAAAHGQRSEEHTSELQSQSNLVCRLLLEKKNTSACDFISISMRRTSGCRMNVTVLP